MLLLWDAFLQEILSMCPVYKKILKHGSNFLTEAKFSGFRIANTPKTAKFVKNGPIFQEKSYPLLPKGPLTMGRGF